MCGGSPKAPKAPEPLPAAPTAPDTTSSRGDADKRRRRAASGEGSRSTILTGAQGVQDGASTSSKTLLGQ